MNLEDYNWHDAIIKEIIIDRNNPGVIDTVSFVIKWMDSGISKVIFEDVYWLNMRLNFGIVADETILDAISGDNSDQDLTNLYLKWKGYLDNIKLNVYLIKLNSTGGDIKIISRDLKIL